MEPVKIPFCMLNGIRFPEGFKENIEEASKFRPHDNDIVLATYPKCGTTWMECILANLLYYDECGGNFKKIKDLCPFIEREGVKMLTPGSLFKTHLPFNADTFNPNAKYIIVVRNPRDVAVSFYYHVNRVSDFDLPEYWFRQYAESFVKGETWFGDYFQHVIGWLDGTKVHGQQKNVLWVVFEKMKLDPKAELIRVAEFLGGQAAEIVKNDEKLSNILDWTSFDSLKKAVNPIYRSKVRDDPSKSVHFIRKGIVGDHVNHFTQEIQEMFDIWIDSNPRNHEFLQMFDI